MIDAYIKEVLRNMKWPLRIVVAIYAVLAVVSAIIMAPYLWHVYLVAAVMAMFLVAAHLMGKRSGS